MVLTWFGTCRPGYPFTNGVTALCEESTNNHGEVQTGTMAGRFATQEFAEHFIEISDGLEVHYAQYEALGQLTRDELRANRPAPPVI